MHKHDTSSSASGLFAACTVEAFRRASLPAAQISAAALAAQWPESLRDCRALAAETGEAVATAEPVVFWLCLEPEVLPSLDPGFSTRPLEQKTEELRRILERELTRQAEPGLSVALRVIAARFSPAVLEAAARELASGRCAAVALLVCRRAFAAGSAPCVSADGAAQTDSPNICFCVRRQSRPLRAPKESPSPCRALWTPPGMRRAVKTRKSSVADGVRYAQLLPGRT